jgi:putative DNA primase/helicase
LVEKSHLKYGLDIAGPIPSDVYFAPRFFIFAGMSKTLRLPDCDQQALLDQVQVRLAERAGLEMHEATAERMVEELRNNNSGVSQTAYHQAKQIEATPGAPQCNGDVLVPGYDAEGKLWTVQYIKEDGTKRFAKNSRKHGCFHVVDAPNGAAAVQKIAMSPMVVIAEGYATAATLAQHGKVPTFSRLRLRESSCGRDIHPRALA